MCSDLMRGVVSHVNPRVINRSVTLDQVHNRQACQRLVLHRESTRRQPYQVVVVLGAPFQLLARVENVHELSQFSVDFYVEELVDFLFSVQTFTSVGFSFSRSRQFWEQ